MSNTTITIVYVALTLLVAVAIGVWKARDAGVYTLADVLAALVLGAFWPAVLPCLMLVFCIFSTNKVVVWRRK